MTFRVNLIVAARRLHTYCKLFHYFPRFFHEQVLDRALLRYEFCWMPLLASLNYSDQVKLAPPLDVRLMWHCHMFDSREYTSDCIRCFGRVIDCPEIEFEDLHDYECNAKNLWEQTYPEEPFHLDIFSHIVTLPQDHLRCRFYYDIKQSVLQCKNFYENISGPFFTDNHFLHVSLNRYKMFLHLSKQSRTQLIPPYDIALVWRAHQLSPIKYAQDCPWLSTLASKHSPREMNEERLCQQWNETCRLWLNLYGEHLERAGIASEIPLPLPEASASMVGKLGCQTPTSSQIISLVQKWQTKKMFPFDASCFFYCLVRIEAINGWKKAPAKPNKLMRVRVEALDVGEFIWQTPKVPVSRQR